MADRGPSPLLPLRAAVVLLGLAAGTLLVQALDQGLSDEPRPLSVAHASWGALLAVTVMPGPLLGFFVGPGSGEKARGLAVGGCGVTAFAALLGGVFAFRRIGTAGTLSVETLTTAWAAFALLLAAIDFLRLRGGGDAKA